MEYHAIIKDGKLILPKILEDFISKQDELRVLIDFNKLPLSRSKEQNRLYWKIVKAYQKFFKSIDYSFTPEEMHKALTRKHIPEEVYNPLLGESEIIGKSTKKLSVAEMSELIDSYKRGFYEMTGEEIII